MRGHKSAYIDCLHKTCLAAGARFQRTDAVLEFGCGIGRLAAWLAPKVAFVHAVDRNVEMVRRAVERLSAASNVSVAHQTGVAIPYPDGAFDKITCIWVLQHIVDEEELRQTLEKLGRVTRPGGRLLILERVADDPSEPWLPAGVIVRRPRESYERLFRVAGLECRSALVVRDERAVLGSPALGTWLEQGWIPHVTFPVLARLDLGLKRLRPARGGCDLLFVCDRRGPAA